MKCDRKMSACICDDADERIAALENNPAFAIDWEAIKAERFLKRFEIQKEREAIAE